MIKIKLFSKFIKAINSLRRDLAIIFLASILIILLNDFILSDILISYKTMLKISSIINKLCFSYVSAFIFYFLVVHLKNQKDKDNLYRYISYNISSIISQAKSMSLDLSKNANINLRGDLPNIDELIIILENTNPYHKAPLMEVDCLTQSNWLQYLEYKRFRSIKAINNIFRLIHHIDTELIDKLSKIEDCNFFIRISHTINSRPIRNESILFFRYEFIEYLELIENMQVYYDKNYRLD